MSNLRGFLWSMGRCGLKAISDSIRACTDAEATHWIDTARFIESPQYHFMTHPRPFIFVMHQPQYAAAFQSLLATNRELPVLFVVREPLANLRSCAKTFLTSYIARRVDATAALVAKGQFASADIRPEAVDSWLLPMVDYWGHWLAIKASRHLVVEFDDLAANRFVDTVRNICDFLNLDVVAPIEDSGPANLWCDVFFAGYTRTISFLDRDLELRFSRWPDYWHEAGLVRIGELQCAALGEMLGGNTKVYVHAKAEKLLTEGRFDREREGFAKLIEVEEVAQALAAQLTSDYRDTMAFVDRELVIFQTMVARKFDAKYGDGMKKFLQANPVLARKWSSTPAVLAS